MNALGEARRLKPRLSSAQRRALSWLAKNGGHAKPDRHARLVATNAERSGQVAGTWLRLVCLGFVARSPLPGHIGITHEGLEVLQ